jgi:hypothetical protein
MNIIVVVLCIVKLDCSRPDINTSIPIMEAEKNPWSDNVNMDHWREQHIPVFFPFQLQDNRFIPH